MLRQYPALYLHCKAAPINGICVLYPSVLFFFFGWTVGRASYLIPGTIKYLAQKYQQQAPDLLDMKTCKYDV